MFCQNLKIKYRVTRDIQRLELFVLKTSTSPVIVYICVALVEVLIKCCFLL